MSNNYIYFKELSHTIIGIAFKVHTKLGSGLPEFCYQSALDNELTDQQILHTCQQSHQVFYNDDKVGHFFSDIIVDNKIILELKSTDCITTNHQAQLFTYLRTSKLKVGYILNFGCASLQFKRLIL